MELATEIAACAVAGLALLFGLTMALARSVVTDKDMEGY
jgi:hypothetical protein